MCREGRVRVEAGSRDYVGKPKGLESKLKRHEYTNGIVTASANETVSK